MQKKEHCWIAFLWHLRRNKRNIRFSLKLVLWTHFFQFSVFIILRNALHESNIIGPITSVMYKTKEKRYISVCGSYKELEIMVMDRCHRVTIQFNQKNQLSKWFLYLYKFSYKTINSIKTPPLWHSLILGIYLHRIFLIIGF